jgi:L-proline amide hydrolase
VGRLLAAEWTIRQPKGLRRLVIADASASMPFWSAAANRWRKELPESVQAVLNLHEREGTTESEEYKKAVDVFNSRYTCRLDPMPAELVYSFEQIGKDPTVYMTMNGPNEFSVVGTLKDWTIVDRVHKMRVTTLVVNGKYDSADDEGVAPFVEGIPGAKWVKFQESSHMPHLEEREKFYDVLSKFLKGEELPETKR